MSAYEDKLAEVIDGLDKEYQLIHISYDDELSNEQVQNAIEDNFEALFDSIWEWESDSRWEGAKWHMENDVSTEDREELEELFETEVNLATLAGTKGPSYDPEMAILEEIQERDRSNVIEDLLRNTPDKFFRYWLDVPVDTGWSSSEEEVEEQIQAIAEAVGIDLEATRTVGKKETTNRQALWTILAESSSGGSLWFFWSGAPSDVIPACWGDHPEDQTITWEEPFLLCFDSWNGSGFMEKIAGTYTRPFDRDDLKLDARGVGNGYSWNDDVCGGLYGCEVDVTITKEDA